MRLAKRMVLIILISLLSLFGCQSRDQKAEKKILEALQEKYGEEFVLDGIGGGYGTMNSNTLKGVVYLKRDPSIRVSVEITKDFQNVYDDYLNEVVARASLQPIEDMAKSIWPDARVTITNDTGMTYPEHTDVSMSYEEFLKLYPMNLQLISVFLNVESYIDQEGNMDQEAEVAKYLAFGELLKENKYLRSSVSIIYLNPEAYSRFDKALESSLSVTRFFHKEEQEQSKLNFVTRVGFTLLEDGLVHETTDEIHQYFDIWKEKRDQYIQGGA